MFKVPEQPGLARRPVSKKLMELQKEFQKIVLDNVLKKNYTLV